MKIFRSGAAKVFYILFFVALYFLLSVRGLYVDVINPDGINWHVRTRAFIEALDSQNYSLTYQVYHPGITLMWISGPLLDIFTHGSTRTAYVSNPKGEFLNLDYYAKLSVVVFCTLIFLLILIIMWKTVDIKYTLFFALVFSLEPFLIGMRRLYHLDYLMTVLIFISFLLLIYYNYKSTKWFVLILAGMFFSLALLTKTTAVIFLPAVPFIFLLGNPSALKKLGGFLLYIISCVVFIYAFFPPIWQDTRKDVPKYYDLMVAGVKDIGVEGRKEIGNSGEDDSVVLEDTVNEQESNFYISSLFMRLSVAGGVLVLISLSVYLTFAIKGFFLTIWNTLKSKTVPRVFSYSADSWISFWSLGISLAFIIALSIPVKKSDRYEIVVFPFLIAIIAYFLRKLKLIYAVLIVLVYTGSVLYELNLIHPYYVAYSNPLLGGISTRLFMLDDAPFGIGTYASFDIVKKDREMNGQSGYYTISGSKSIKAIAAGGKFSRYPACVTDYTVVYFKTNPPIFRCGQKYKLIGTVKISGFDYWYVYKRLNQAHASQY